MRGDDEAGEKWKGFNTSQGERWSDKRRRVDVVKNQRARERDCIKRNLNCIQSVK